MDFVQEFFFPGGAASFFRMGITLLVLFVSIRKLLSQGKYAKFPPTANGLYIPWLGHIYEFGKDPVQFFVNCGTQIGEVASFTLFGKDVVYMSGPEAQKVFYESPEEVLCARDSYKFTIPCFGANVVYDAPDHKFQQQRKFAANALTRRMFEIYVPRIAEETENYLNSHFPDDEGVLDFTQAINEITVLTSTAALQGPEVRAQVNEGYSDLITALDHALTSVGFFYPDLPLPAYRNRDIARRKIGTMFAAILKRRRQTNYRGEDMLQVLMDSKYDDGTQLPDDEIVGLLVALMMAGQHTSNITSSWLMLNILAHQNVKERVLEEQDEFAPPGAPFEYENINKMDYLGNVMKETLLKFPPIIVVFRTVKQDFQYKNYVIPEGSLVCVSPAAYPRLPNSGYTNFHEFDPDRFAPPREEHRKPYTFFPFSSGRHACIGEKFAFLQVKTIASVFFRHFDLELIGTMKDHPVDNASLLAAPKGSIMIKYRRKK